jgi:hypothetical protein
MPKKTSQLLGPAIPVRFHPEVVEHIKEAAEKTRLSDADTIRKATEMGLPLLLEALGFKSPRARRTAKAA